MPVPMHTMDMETILCEQREPREFNLRHAPRNTSALHAALDQVVAPNRMNIQLDSDSDVHRDESNTRNRPVSFNTQSTTDHGLHRQPRDESIHVLPHPRRGDLECDDMIDLSAAEEEDISRDIILAVSSGPGTHNNRRQTFRVGENLERQSYTHYTITSEEERAWNDSSVQQSAFAFLSSLRGRRLASELPEELQDMTIHSPGSGRHTEDNEVDIAHHVAFNPSVVSGRQSHQDAPEDVEECSAQIAEYTELDSTESNTGMAANGAYDSVVHATAMRNALGLSSNNGVCMMEEVVVGERPASAINRRGANGGGGQRQRRSAGQRAAARPPVVALSHLMDDEDE